MGPEHLPAAPANDAVTWHARRHRAILRDHPDVRRLFGADPTSAFWIVALTLAQLTLSVGATHLSMGKTLALAITVGAVLAHALGVLIHETAHNLASRSAAMNKALGIVANLALGAPAAAEFRQQHLLHHKHLGDARDPDGRDTQAPTSREVRFVGHATLRKLASFTFGRFVYRARPANAVPHDRWFVANVVSCVAVDLTLAAIWGWRPLAYVLVSALVAFGPHVLGARRLSEHLTIRRGQPTNSYYGPLNRLSFDVGFHVEHHDFPAVPCRRLRRLNRIASEHYDRLAAVGSWSSLMVAYVMDPRYGVGQYTGVSAEYLEEPWSPEPAPALPAQPPRSA